MATLNIYLDSCMVINLQRYLGIYLERHLLGHMLWRVKRRYPVNIELCIGNIGIPSVYTKYIETPLTT